MLLPRAPQGSSGRSLFCPDIRSDMRSHRVSDVQSDRLVSTLAGFCGRLCTSVACLLGLQGRGGVPAAGEVTSIPPRSWWRGLPRTGAVSVPGTQGVFLGL